MLIDSQIAAVRPSAGRRAARAELHLARNGAKHQGSGVADYHHPRMGHNWLPVRRRGWACCQTELLIAQPFPSKSHAAVEQDRLPATAWYLPGLAKNHQSIRSLLSVVARQPSWVDSAGDPRTRRCCCPGFDGSRHVPRCDLAASVNIRMLTPP